MGLFITTRSQATRHAVYAEERSNPTAIVAEGTGTAGMVGRFPWGPDDAVYIPTDSGDRLMTFAPPGMDHLATGYLAFQGKPFTDLRIVRALGTAAVKATATLSSAGPTTIATVQAKYKGVAGNSLVATVSNASDGVAGHFNLTVSVTGASGFTADDFANLDMSAGQPALIEGLARAKLVGAITWVANGRPLNGTYTFSTGADGTIDSAAYLGTPGNGDKGLALFEGDQDVDVLFADDCGSGLRAAVNAGLHAHQLLMGDRIVVLNGNSGVASAATVQTTAALNPGTGTFFVDCWTYQRDDIDGTERLVAPAPWLAAVVCALPPSTSAAWKSQTVRNFLAGITRLEFQRGSAAGNNTLAGVCTLIKERKGGHSFEAFVNTAAPVSPTKKRGTRTRMGIFIAKSITESLRESIDAPNMPQVQNDVISAVNLFMEGLKDNGLRNPTGLAHVKDWSFGDLEAANPAADIDNGDFTIPLNVKTSAGMERIFLSIQYGENVTITSSDSLAA